MMDGTFHSAEPLGPGVHRVSEQTYHADPADRPSLSSTIARQLLFQSPLHAWWAHPKLNPNFEPVEKKTFDIGRAAHRAVLSAGAGYVAYPEDMLASNGAASTKAAKEWAEVQREAGLTPLKAEEVDAIGLMAEKVHARLAEMNIALDSDRSELVALAEISRTMCRMMCDNAPENPAEPLYDFKTTVDASPAACVKAVLNYGYDVQACFYLETWKAATGEDRTFRFIFQEKTAPFEVSVVELDDAALMMARKKTARARDIWHKCVSSNHWPGYPPGIHRVTLPDWHHEKWLERESVEQEFSRQHKRDILDAWGHWQREGATFDPGPNAYTFTGDAA